MRLQAEQTVAKRIITLLLKERNREELTLGLTHFSALRVQMMHMEPIVAPLMAEGTLALRDLVGVMRECVIDTTAMDIQILTKELLRNTGALNMPTGIAEAEGRFPLQLLIVKLGLGEPKNEVCLVALIGILLNAVTHANLEILLGEVVKYVILFQL